MTKFDQVFFLVDAPRSPEDAQALSQQITLEYGNKGLSLVSMVLIGNRPHLLLAFQKVRA